MDCGNSLIHHGMTTMLDSSILNNNFLIPSADNVLPLLTVCCPRDGEVTDDNNNTTAVETSHVMADGTEYTLDDDVFLSEEQLAQEIENYENVHMVGGLASSEHRELLYAAYQSVQSNKLTPLLKHELKFFIQSRRMSEGKSEMEVQFDEPISGQLRTEELERRERRKQQNRMAAKRFRQKRKSSEESLLQTIEALHKTNQELTEQAQQLRKEKQELMDIVAAHLVHCPIFPLEPLVGVLAGDGIP